MHIVWLVQKGLAAGKSTTATACAAVTQPPSTPATIADGTQKNSAPATIAGGTQKEGATATIAGGAQRRGVTAQIAGRTQVKKDAARKAGAAKMNALAKIASRQLNATPNTAGGSPSKVTLAAILRRLW